jgi:hypothetical protein
MPLAMPVFGVSDAWITPGLVASLCALLFTIGSFWWIQVRRGRLRGYVPSTYSASFAPAKIVLILPLVIYNPAPAPLVVTGLRARVDVTKARRRQHPKGTNRTGELAALPRTLHWHASHTMVYPNPTLPRVFASPFPVEGRKAVEKFIEFQWDAPTTDLANGPYALRVDVRVEPRRWWSHREWQKLLSYELNSHLLQGNRAALLPRSNDPDMFSPPLGGPASG